MDPRFFRHYLDILGEESPIYAQRNQQAAQKWAKDNPKSHDKVLQALDIATDFTPVIGQAKALYRAGQGISDLDLDYLLNPQAHDAAYRAKLAQQPVYGQSVASGDPFPKDQAAKEQHRTANKTQPAADQPTMSAKESKNLKTNSNYKNEI